MAQISARVSEEIRKRFKIAALQNGTSTQEIIEKAVLDYLAKSDENAENRNTDDTADEERIKKRKPERKISGNTPSKESKKRAL